MSEIEKGLRARMTARMVARSFKAAGREDELTRKPIELNFKSVPKRNAAPTGPGSARSYMSGAAMTTQDDAVRRVAKSAFGVDQPIAKADKKKSVKGAAATGALGGAVAAQAGAHALGHAASNSVSPSFRALSAGAKAKRHLRAVPGVTRQLATTKNGLIFSGTGAGLGAGLNAARRAHKNHRAAEKQSAFGVDHE